MLGGAGIGGIVTSIAIVVVGEVPIGFDNIWRLLFAPLLLAVVSLIFIVPCTLIGGIPSALIVRSLDLTGWLAFAVCIVGALATTALFYNFIGFPPMEGKWLTPIPFALGVAFTLWWQLTSPQTMKRKTE